MNQRKTLKINSNGQLEIGGITAQELKEKYGTPLYVMDQAYIENMCKIFASTLKKEYGDGLVCYASKAFCCKKIYKIIDKYGLGADSVSLGELFTAQKAGFPADKMCLHGNNKSIEELTFAIEVGVKYIVIDSIEEAEMINDIAKESNVIQSVLIRVNPGVEAHTHEFIQTAKVDSKFGFSIQSGEATEIIKQIINKKNLKLEGLHCHIGSQIFEQNSFSIAVEKMTDFYKTIKDELNLEFNVLNLGGGFGIYYSEGDTKRTCKQYASYIKNISKTLLDCVAKKQLKKPYLILEPGRSIVGEAGVTLYTVGSVKQIKEVKNYVAIDGGMFENPRYALYRAKYTVVSANKMNELCDTKYSIAGKCCESGDIIAEDCMLPPTKKGDLLAVLSTGAYNYSMASNYNRNLIPAVVFVKNKKSKIAIKKQTLKDLIKNDI